MEYENILLGMLGGAICYVIMMVLSKLIKKEGYAAKLEISCPKCRSKKLKPMGNDRSKLICTKCYSVIERDMAEAPSPPPPVFACKYCQKTFDTENKVRKHIGMSHSDKLEI